MSRVFYTQAKPAILLLLIFHVDDPFHSANRISRFLVDAAKVQVSLWERDDDSCFSKRFIDLRVQVVDHQQPTVDLSDERANNKVERTVTKCLERNASRRVVDSLGMVLTNLVKNLFCFLHVRPISDTHVDDDSIECVAKRPIHQPPSDEVFVGRSFL